MKKREEYVLTHVQYWGRRENEHMFGEGEAPLSPYTSARYLITPLEDGDYHCLAYNRYGLSKRELSTPSAPKRMIDLLRMIAFPVII